MAERFANNAQSTLNGAIDNSQTSVPVLNAASFPDSGDFRIKIDNELMLVTGMSGNTFTATRGIEETIAVVHNNQRVVRHVMTAGGLAAVSIPSITPNYVVGRKSDDSGHEQRYLQRTLLDFGADPTGVALCDTAFANYIIYLENNNAPICSIPVGQYKISHPLDFRSASLVGLKIQGEYACSNGTFFGTGVVFLWTGATPTDDVILLGQQYQKIENIHIRVQTPARNIVTWQRTISSAGAMTEPIFRRVSAGITLAGSYQVGIAITPDNPHNMETNHDNGIIDECVFFDFTVAGVKNFNNTGQAYKWFISNCNFSGTHPTNTCYGVYWTSGFCECTNIGYNAVSVETHYGIAPYQSSRNSYSESSGLLYHIGGGANATIVDMARHSFSWASVGAYPTMWSPADDYSPGPRWMTSIYFQHISGTQRNFSWKAGSCGNSGSITCVVASILPTCNPFAEARTPFSRTSINEYVPLGTVGTVPASYDDLDTPHEYKTAVVRDVQNIENPWLIDSHGANISTFLVGGPHMLTDAWVDNVQLHEWLSDDGQIGAVASTVATGRTKWLGTTQTGYGQALVGSEGLDGVSPRAAMQIVSRTNINPGVALSWFVAMVIRPVTAAKGTTVYQCAAGKGASTDDPGATHFSCMISPTGYPVLRWGRSSSEQFATSTHKILLDQTDHFVLWGVDVANNHVVYMNGTGNLADSTTNTPERITISGSPALVFNNTLALQIGCDAAGANPFDGGITMLVMRTGPFSDRLLQYHARQVCRLMGIAAFQ